MRRSASVRPRPAWSPEECGAFAARRTFELARLLSTDARALATFRRLGFAAYSSLASGAATAHGARASSAAEAAAAEAAAQAEELTAGQGLEGDDSAAEASAPDTDATL